MEDREIVIIGGGIIGCTTAYYLSRHSSAFSTKITLIEASAHGPAQGASGKAGGLVARWAYPKEIVDVSFKEHVKLANEYNGKERWGWRYVSCGSWEGRGEAVQVDEGSGASKSLEKTLGLPGAQKPLRKRSAGGFPEDLKWVKEELTDAYSPMANSGETAQVHPYLFTTSMFELAKENGVHYVQARATAVLQQNGVVSGVEYINQETKEKEKIHASAVLIAAGAWSPTIVKELPVMAMRAHSITIRPKDGVQIAPYVLFTEISGLASTKSTPEIYARPDNEIYACGSGDDFPLPLTVDDVIVDQKSCDLIHQQVISISNEVREGTVEKRQACYLPSVSVNFASGPIIGEARQIAKGLFVGTGHTCWGISNAPGTARALTELIMDGKVKCASLNKLDPSRFL